MFEIVIDLGLLTLLCLLIIFVFVFLIWCALALGAMADRRTYKDKE